MNYVEQYLAHHGVLGMKWGVRRYGSSGSSSGRFRSGDKRARGPVAEDHAKASASRSKPVSQLSNQDLQHLISRMQLEMQYSKLTEKAPPPATATRVQKGKQYVTRFVATHANQQINRVASKAIDIGVERALSGNKMAKGEFRTELSTRIAPKQKKKGN